MAYCSVLCWYEPQKSERNIAALHAARYCPSSFLVPPPPPPTPLRLFRTLSSIVGSRVYLRTTRTSPTAIRKNPTYHSHLSPRRGFRSDVINPCEYVQQQQKTVTAASRPHLGHDFLLRRHRDVSLALIQNTPGHAIAAAVLSPHTQRVLIGVLTAEQSVRSDTSENNRQR